MTKRWMPKHLVAFGLVVLALLSPLALANQSNTWSPTTGTVSGLALTNNYNSALSAIQSCNSGNAAPANDISAAAVKGQCWLDTSVSPNVLKQYDGTSWLVLGYLDVTNHRWIPVVGGGTATVASSATTDLCGTPESGLSISGTTTITSFGSSCQVGQIKTLTFSGALTLTHAGSLFLPNNGNNITTAANSKALAQYNGSGNWIVLVFVNADGTAVNASSTFAGAVSFNGPISITLGVTTNNWNPAGLATANVIRLTCSSAINVTGLVAPATDGKILVVDNVGATNTCTFTAEDANSTAANRFSFDRPAGLRAGRSMTIKYDLTAARWRRIDSEPSQPIAGGFKNLKIVNGGTPNNQLAVTADELTVEDTNGGAARLSAVNCTADITAAGAAGLDTGAVAQNTGYYLWVIFSPSTNTQSCMFSLQSAFGSITLPSGYTYAARVGWDFVENLVGKRLNRILCFGRRCQYVVTASSATAAYPPAITGSSGNPVTPTYTSVSLSALVPATASTVHGTANAGTSSATAQLIVSPNNLTGAVGLSANPPLVNLNIVISSGSIGAGIAFSMIMETAQTIFYASNSGANSGIYVTGWEDNL